MKRVISVWLMDEAATRPPVWRRVHEAVLGEMWEYYLNMPSYHEKPVDFAGACGEFIVVDKGKCLLRYDLDSGHKVPLFSLYRDTVRLGALYRRYHAFAFFR